MRIIGFNILFLLFLLNSCVYADCIDTQTLCIEKGETRYFDGLAVTLPCWKYQMERKCSSPTDDNCKELRTAKCVQIDSRCRTVLENICTVQDEIYSCKQEECKDMDGIICGGNFYCMNGDCSKIDSSKNGNFGKVVSGLAAIGTAATDIKNNNGIKAFSGKSLECSEDIVGFKNCCERSGWGLDLIAHCSDDEKELYDKRNKSLTVSIGEYCANRFEFPGGSVCLSTHQVDCVFGSKLAKIVQNQGRREQLQISFGDVAGDESHPDCRGITVDELSKINFSKIDFQEVYQDIKDHVQFPGKGNTENAIAARVKEFYEKHKQHG